MNIKYLKIINTFIIFFVCFLVHYIYELVPSSFTSIFFPVNESIFEHMKMLFTSYMVAGIIEFLIIKYKDLSVNNYLFNLFITALLSIPIYLIIFLPLNVGHSMIIILSIMFITIVFTQVLSYFIIIYKKVKYLNIFSFILIIISYIIFGYLTYKPFKTPFFFDTDAEKYGINIYRI